MFSTRLHVLASLLLVVALGITAGALGDGGDSTKGLRAPIIAHAPTNPSVSSSAEFVWDAGRGRKGTYECRLDAPRDDALEWTPCESPTTYSGLSVGVHVFEVVAIDGDVRGTAARNLWSIEPAPASVPATPTITSAPPSATTNTTASFGFSDATAGVTFLCRVDAMSFAACTSPKSYAGLAVGQHSFDVKARDSGGLESGVASVSWEIQAPTPSSPPPPAPTPPATPTIGSSPQTTTTSTSASFTFSDTTAGVTFLCNADATSFAACTSPKTYSGLALGAHTFNVKARDSLGLESGVATLTWQILTAVSSTPPATPTITSAPPSATTNTTASFGFSDATAGVTFLCRVDAMSFAACTSPKSYAGLAVGQHSFDVKARDSGGLESGVASVSWEIQAPTPSSPPPPAPTPPATPTIGLGPGSVTNSTSASFSFSSTTAAVTYLCRVDAAMFATCTSAKSYSSVSAGGHSFDVKARDSSGLESGVASTSWIVDLTLPTVTITSPTAGSTLSNMVTAAATASDNVRLERVEFRVDGTLRGTSTIAPHTFSWDTTKDTNGSHTLDVRSFDVAGNQSAPLSEGVTVSNVTAPSSCSGVQVNPGTDLLQALVSSNPDGTTFCLNAGVHRLTSAVTPRSSDSFVGAPGAILSGARLLTGFAQSGSTWYVGGQSMEGYGDPGYGSDPCGPPYGPSGSKLCLYSNDVYFDDSRLTRVGSQSEVGPGKFFFDYGADRIYIGDNPSGHKVEVGVAPQALHAFGTGTTDVHLSGFTVEKFATPAGDAALQGRTGYTFDHMEVRLNHAGGIIGFQSVTSSYIHDNGQFGASVDNTNGAVVDGNEFASNHRTPIVCWHSADVKVMRTLNTVIRNNYAHDGTCGGLWQDWDNKGVLVEGNRVEHIGSPGIEAEASCNTTIRNNIVKDSGWGAETQNSWLDGSAILAYSSHDVDVYGNTVESTGTGGGRHGISGVDVDRGSEVNCGSLRTYNLRVHNNQIKDTATGTNRGYGVAAGLAGTIAQPFTTQAFFDRNVYTICSGTNFGGATSPSATYWDTMSWSQWRGQGQDPNSTVSYVC